MSRDVWSGLRVVATVVFALGVGVAGAMPTAGWLAGVVGGHCNDYCSNSTLQPCAGDGCAGQEYCECGGMTYYECKASVNHCATAPNCDLPGGHSPCHCAKENACGNWS